MPERRQFLAVGHELGTFAQFGAIDSENLVVGAGDQIIAGIVVGLVALPDPNPLQADERGFVVLHGDIDTAALAIDAAAEVDFLGFILGDDMAAEAAGVEIARPVARALGAPLDYFSLVRVRATAPQTGMTLAARRKNLRNAFRLRDPATVRGRHVALVDDVMTTGSTVQAAAHCLRRAGVETVEIWVVARA